MKLSISNKLTSLLSKREYLWGFIVFCLFFTSLVSSQSGMDIFAGVMFLTAIYWTLRYRGNSWHWPRIGLLGLFLTWIVVIALGLTVNPVHGSLWDQLFEFRWMIDFYIFVLFISVYSQDSRTLKNFSFLMALASGMAICFYFLGYNPLTEDISIRAGNLADFANFRAGGLFDHAMPLAHSYGPLLLVFVGLLLVNRTDFKKLPFLTYLAVALMAVTVVLTFTRGIWIGAACGLVLMGFFLSRRWGLYILGGLLAIGLLTFATSEKIRHRVIETVTMSNQGDQERMTIWKSNWEMTKDHPLIGIGYSQNKARLREYYDRLGVAPGYFEGHAHNEYMHLLSGTGLLGLLCYLIFLGYAFRAAYLAFKHSRDNESKGLALGLMGAMTCFYIGSLTEANFSIGKNRHMILFLMAWAVFLWLKERNAQNNQKIQRP
jgi:O-antigen ligase